VLRATASGEADRIVTLFGRSTGKTGVVARSARKSTRRFGGGLGLAAAGTATLRERPGAELGWLESFEIERARERLGTDIGAMAHAGYVAELCEQLLGAHQPEPALYDFFAAFLDALEAGGPNAARMRVFELGLLERLGLGSSFASCVACGRSDLGDETVRLEPERGGVTCPGCARRGTPIGRATREALVELGGCDFAEAEALALSREVNAAARAAIAELITPHLSRPLKSLEFLRKLQSG
jgi:DNA repair protein RecO (recombination protein O)